MASRWRDGNSGMANAPLKFCQKAGCHNFAVFHSAYCAEHTKQRDEHKAMLKNVADKFRKTAYERGYTREWSRAAKAWLIEHPWCAECLKNGEHTPATEVDHITPHKGDKKLFWRFGNWQSLCHSCHSKKTAKERGTW